MSDEQNPPRLYGEKEVGALLKRATELQERESGSSLTARGLTLAELQEIAAEAGIDPRLLERAALEMDRGRGAGSGWERVRGGPDTIVMERTVRGEVPPDKHWMAVEVIQRRAGLQGQPAVVGRMLTWRAMASQNAPDLLVTVTPRDGHTHIRVEESLRQIAWNTHGGIAGGAGGGVGLGVGLGIGIGALGSALFSVAVPLGVLGLSYITARNLFAVQSRRRQRILSTLMEELTHTVESIAVTSSEDGGGTPALDAGS